MFLVSLPYCERQHSINGFAWVAYDIPFSALLIVWRIAILPDSLPAILYTIYLNLFFFPFRLPDRDFRQQFWSRTAICKILRIYWMKFNFTAIADGVRTWSIGQLKNTSAVHKFSLLFKDFKNCFLFKTQMFGDSRTLLMNLKKYKMEMPLAVLEQASSQKH